MGCDVYISYSFRDREIADIVCASLERDGISCRYIPRDAADGGDQEAASDAAIRSARIMVLIFTEASNGESRVIREVGCAVSAGVILVPFVLSPVPPAMGMQYYLSTVHWLDAIDMPPEKSIPMLSRRVRSILAGREAESPAASEADRDDSRSARGRLRPLRFICALAAAAAVWISGLIPGTDIPSEFPDTDTAAVIAGNGVPEEAENTPAEEKPNVPEGIRTVADLTALPPEKQQQISGLIIAGDRVFDPDRVLVSSTDDNGTDVVRVTDRDTGETTVIAEKGTLTNLKTLGEMANLRVLTLALQPLENLAGAEKLKQLERIRLVGHTALQDLSPLFTLTELQEIRVDNAPELRSIEGIGALKKLCALEIYGADRLDSLAPLAECDFSFVNTEGNGFIFGFEGEKVIHYKALSMMTDIQSMDVTDYGTARWRSDTEGVRIHSLTVRHFLSQSRFETMMKSHPEIEHLKLTGCDKLTDLSILAKSMPELKTLELPRDALSLVKTLEEQEYSFEIMMN